MVEDPAGNSYIGDPGGAALPEGEAAPAPGGAPADPQLTVEHYQRSAAEQERLGVGPGSPEEEEGGGGAAEGAGAEGGQQRKPAVMQLVEGEAAARLVDRYAQGGSLSSGGGEVGAGPCPACGAERSGQERQLLPSVGLGNCTLLDTHCCGCGLRAVELRRGGGSGPASSANGLRIQLAVEQPADLERDVIASSSASLVIPELGLAFSGGEEGVFTTVGALVRTVSFGIPPSRGCAGVVLHASYPAGWHGVHIQAELANAGCVLCSCPCRWWMAWRARKRCSSHLPTRRRTQRSRNGSSLPLTCRTCWTCAGPLHCW